MIELQRTDEFFGRTTNSLYDYLRFVPRCTPTVVCDTLANRPMSFGRNDVGRSSVFLFAGNPPSWR
jgi:hypothetical protein